MYLRVFQSSSTTFPGFLDYTKLCNDLTTEDGLVLYGFRLVVPASLRNDTIALLHDSHGGIETSKHRARQTVWWPCISSDITNRVWGGTACQELISSLPIEPLLSDPQPLYPFEDVSADLFTYASNDYLIYGDRLSGWLCLVQYGRDATSRTTTRFLNRLFRDVVAPVRIRTDGGPQFASSLFRQFVNR